MGFSTTYLGCVNILAALVGVAVICTGIYVFIQGNAAFPDGFGYTDWHAWVAVGVGAAIVVLSLIACCCEATLQNRYVIAFFGLLQLIFGILLLVVGAALCVLAGDYINTIVATDRATFDVAPGLGGLQQDMSDILLGLFDGCCNGTVPPLEACPDFNTYEGKQYCWESSKAFFTGSDIGADHVNSYCVFAELPDHCPSDIPSFLRRNQELLQVYVYPAGIACVVFGVLIFLASVLSCRIGCLTSRTFSQYQARNNVDGVQKIHRPGQQITYY